MTRKLKIAIVGCGQIADGHISEVQKMDNAEVVGVCDLEILMAEQAASRYRIPRYYDQFSEMLEKEQPDVVHITTPPQSHLSLATAAIDAGCHVYVEKPFTPTYKETVKLIQHAENNNKKLTIGHIYFFDPPALALRQMVREGTIGNPVHVESFYGYSLAGPFGKAIMGNSTHWVHKLPGKLFHNNIDHLLNKIIEFIDDEQPAIKVFGGVRRTTRVGDIRDEMPDELRVMIQGKSTSAYATFSSHIKPTAHFMRLYGTKNIAHADFVARTLTLEQEPTLPSAIGRLLPAFNMGKQYRREGWKNVGRFIRSDFHFFSGMHHLISGFYDSILHDAPLPISHRDIRRIGWMMDEIFRQLDEQVKES